MKVVFISSVSPIVKNPSESRKLFVDALGLPLEPHEGVEYISSEKVGGSKHFGVWPLAEAAEACFGTRDWPADRPVPQVSIEFELENEAAVSDGARELEARGYPLLHPTRTEPWGQTIARILTTEGAIIGLSYTPWMHDKATQ